MKLTFNNFAKAYLLASMTIIGWVGGGHAYYIGFKLLELMVIFMVIFTPVMAVLWYIVLKTLLHFKPDAGCRGCRTEGPTDAQDIVRQMEEDFQGLKQCVKHPIQTLILIAMNIVSFLRS